MKCQIYGMKCQMDKIETKVDNLEIQQNENTQILRTLEAAKDVHFAKLDKLENDIAHLTGDVKAIKKDLSIVENVTAKNWNDIIEIKKNMTLN